MSAAKPKAPTRTAHFIYLGLPEARFYIACNGHMHVFRRVGYRSGAFIEDATQAAGQKGGAA